MPMGTGMAPIPIIAAAIAAAAAACAAAASAGDMPGGVGICSIGGSDAAGAA